MENTARRRIRLCTDILLSTLIAAVGLLFIIEAADLYFTVGYSYEQVGSRLVRLIVPVALLFAAIVGAYIVSVLFPEEDRGKGCGPKPSSLARRLRARLPEGTGEEFLAERARLDRLGRSRKLVYLFCTLFAAAGAVYAIVYLANAAHFSGGSVQGEILSLTANVLPWVAVSLALFVGASLYEGVCLKREVAMLKHLLVLGKGLPQATKAGESSPLHAAVSRYGKWILRVLVAGMGITFVVLGVCNGGARDVLAKAIELCTQCIGLG